MRRLLRSYNSLRMTTILGRETSTRSAQPSAASSRATDHSAAVSAPSAAAQQQQRYRAPIARRVDEDSALHCLDGVTRIMIKQESGILSNIWGPTSFAEASRLCYVISDLDHD